MPILAAIMSFLSGWFARILGAGVIRLVIWKTLIWLLVVSIFPIMLYNVMSGLIGEFMELTGTVSEGYNMSPFIIEFTGMMAWLCVKTKIPECLSLIISASMFRLAISMIPFLGRT